MEEDKLVVGTASQNHTHAAPSRHDAVFVKTNVLYCSLQGRVAQAVLSFPPSHVVPAHGLSHIASVFRWVSNTNSPTDIERWGQLYIDKVRVFLDGAAVPPSRVLTFSLSSFV
jgi:hypothetical protein